MLTVLTDIGLLIVDALRLQTLTLAEKYSDHSFWPQAEPTESFLRPSHTAVGLTCIPFWRANLTTNQTQ
jgi:hypothetical protein